MPAGLYFFTVAKGEPQHLQIPLDKNNWAAFTQHPLINQGQG